MTYKQCLEYLFSQLPVYQRIGQAAYKADLKNTIDLLRLLGNPELNFKSIHVAGTNGKGSVSHMLASILQESGYKTGLYTSPHMKDFRERIKINGREISEEKVVNFVEKHRSMVSDIKPSFFEWTVALAFQYFAGEKVDVAVIETGMGGRLDSTNVIRPLLSVITNIGYDHVKFLGNSLEQIATEKAGIIKEGIPVVVGSYNSETRKVFEEKAKTLKAPIVFAQDEKMKLYESDLKGPYQKENQLTLLHCIKVLKSLSFHVNEENIRSGLSRVVNNTGLRGRWEWIGRNPGILLDTAHNADGISVVFREILSLDFKKLHVVLGMVSDKDVSMVLKLLPAHAVYYFCRPDIPRGLDENELRNEAMKFGLSGDSFASVSMALEKAKKVAGRDDLIYVGGSTFVVAEALP